MICPVCGDKASYFDVVDFNKSCTDPLCRDTGFSGMPIYYSRCSGCEFLFTPSIYSWNETQFLEAIYNSDYIKFDGDYLQKRPKENAALLENFFGEQMPVIRHLDYGGGNGNLSEILKSRGWNSVSYDPFPSAEINLQALGRFNLITAFEVFEHVPDVHHLMKNLSSLLLPDGAILIFTLLSDGNVNQNDRLNWWYAAPRNGHISLFSKKSLDHLSGTYGFKVHNLNANLHMLKHELAKETI